jgi:hypothetical protein
MEQLSINSQWKSFILYGAEHSKQGIVAELDCGVTVCWTQSTMQFTNGIFLSSSVSDEADLQRRLEGIKAYVKKAQPTFPWALFIEPELLPPDLRERSKSICSTAEFDYIRDVKCMQTTRLLPPVRSLPASEIKFAGCQEDVHDAFLLTTQACHRDPSIADSMIDQRAWITDLNKQLCCIVSIDGKPVSTTTTALLDDCLYVALVVTHTEHRQVSFILILFVRDIC